MGEQQDEFEAKNMQGDAPVLHRAKKVSRGLAGLLAVAGLFVISLSVIIGALNATSSKPVPSVALPFVVGAIALLGVAFLGLAIVFAVVRTLVTAREVHVKYGLWGPRVPLENIRSCKVVAYDWTEFGGWGIRMGKDGSWAYVPEGPNVVEMRYVEGTPATEKRVLFAVDDPQETARAINRARLPAVVSNLRIEDESSTPSDELADDLADEARRTTNETR